MQKRICPECNKSCFSSDTREEIWICPNCGADIPRDQEDNDFDASK